MTKKLIVRMTLRTLGALFFTLAIVETSVFACPVCYGDQKSAEVEGARWAILFLLGVTGTVLTGVVAFVLRVRRRSRQAPVGVPSSKLGDR